MKKLRVYIDTSVIGGCEDEEFSEDSRRLMEEFRLGLKTAVISDLTHREIESAPEKVRAVLAQLLAYEVENISTDAEALDLAEKYIQEGVVGRNYEADALHIALATINQVDVSWNFRHIVNLQRIRRFNAVNIREGYGTLEIRSPKEVLYGEEI